MRVHHRRNLVLPPVCGSRNVLRNATAFVVRGSEKRFSTSGVLVSRFPIPLTAAE